MTHLTNLAVLLVIACISQQLMVANCQGPKKRGMKKKEKVGPKDESQPKPSVPSTDKRNSSPNVKGVFKGKFTKDKAQCTWVATGADAFVLGVNCKKGEKSFDCEYVARPATCPGYESNAKAYWKQISRSLKKQKKLCMDSTVLIKAGMCRNAPQDAHFKLNKKNQDIVIPLPRTTVQTRSSSETTSRAKSCAVHNKKLAEDYCADSWSSVCAFLFSMVQNDEC
ncbi:fibroblast growth factor-binding protein 1 [Esox lucius]|uniref:Fibroblast growth factor-binding protein 1 n=1 Tax=Esox lucius TaxID=8010 RepID=A0AAY5LB36_ESOLU|nr:fibroblast growth factor-binding protein 1 [Esox lucius]